MSPALADMAFGPVDLFVFFGGPIVVGLAATAGVAWGGFRLVRRIRRKPGVPE